MALLTGGVGGDVLTGGSERDRIDGAGGNDVLGGDGSDSLEGEGDQRGVALPARLALRRAPR